LLILDTHELGVERRDRVACTAAECRQLIAQAVKQRRMLDEQMVERAIEVGGHAHQGLRARPMRWPRLFDQTRKRLMHSGDRPTAAAASPEASGSSHNRTGCATALSTPGHDATAADIENLGIAGREAWSWMIVNELMIAGPRRARSSNGQGCSKDRS